MHPCDEFGGFFVRSVPPDNCAVDLEKLCGFSEDSREGFVVHAGIIEREGQSVHIRG